MANAYLSRGGLRRLAALRGSLGPRRGTGRTRGTCGCTCPSFAGLSVTRAQPPTLVFRDQNYPPHSRSLIQFKGGGAGVSVRVITSKGFLPIQG